MADGGLRALARAAGQGDLEAARAYAGAAARAGLTEEAEGAWNRLARRGDREALELLGGLRRPLRSAPGLLAPLPDLPQGPPGDIVAAEGEGGRVHLRRLASPRDIAREASFVPPTDGRAWRFQRRDDRPGRLLVTWRSEATQQAASVLVDVTPEAFGRVVARLRASPPLVPHLTPELLLGGDDRSLVALVLHDGSIRWRAEAAGVLRVETDLEDVLRVHERELDELALVDGRPRAWRCDRDPMATFCAEEAAHVRPGRHLLVGPVLVAARGHCLRRAGGFDSSWLLALRRETNELLWQRRATGLDLVQLVAATGTLYAAWLPRSTPHPARSGGEVEAIDARSGDSLWRRPVGPCEAIGLTPVDDGLEVSVDGRRSRLEA
jgi:hypothetical protein